MQSKVTRVGSRGDPTPKLSPQWASQALWGPHAWRHGTPSESLLCSKHCNRRQELKRSARATLEHFTLPLTSQLERVSGVKHTQHSTSHSDGSAAGLCPGTVQCHSAPLLLPAICTAPRLPSHPQGHAGHTFCNSPGISTEALVQILASCLRPFHHMKCPRGMFPGEHRGTGGHRALCYPRNQRPPQAVSAGNEMLTQNHRAPQEDKRTFSSEMLYFICDVNSLTSMKKKLLWKHHRKWEVQVVQELLQPTRYCSALHSHRPVLSWCLQDETQRPSLAPTCSLQVCTTTLVSATTLILIDSSLSVWYRNASSSASKCKTVSFTFSAKIF